MPARIKTLYLVPHAHTDLGYTHDPLIAWELHDHFLDRAIDLCEATAELPEPARYCWTIEVFASLEHWWARRDASARERLLALMRAGRIDLGLRYTNGTFLHNPLNLRWEVERATAFCREHALPCATIFQNDINGLSRAHARLFAGQGAGGLVMGLNTTMGVSPLPRPGAFWWDLGDDRRLLVWHGWIYNRIGRWVHLHDLASKLDAVWPELCARLPADYPFDFVMMSGTIGDNVGPFARLPQAVADYNARQTGLEIRLVTISQLLAAVARTPNLPSVGGDWNDAWTFGHGSMPHEVTLVRRAQRRLEVLDALQRSGLHDTAAVRPLAERAQHEVSIACEHTYESHTSADDHTFGNDGKRQWVQSQVSFINADSLSSLALRQALFDLAGSRRVTGPSVLFVNPTAHALPARVLWNRRLATHITTSEVIEHLAQFDREPTQEGLARDADIGVPAILLPPRSVQIVPLQELTDRRAPEIADASAGVELANSHLSLRIDPAGTLASLRLAGDTHDWIDASAAAPSGRPVLEVPDPLTPLKYKSESEKRDPSDAEWNPDLRFLRQPLGALSSLTRRTTPQAQEAVAAYAGSPVRAVTYRLDPLTPDLLHLELELRLGDDTAQKALHFPLAFQLPGDGEVTFRYDSCGDWIEAPGGQLPGSGTSFYESYRGMTLERGGRCLYVIAPDTPLWQVGGFTSGHPHAKLDRSRATVVSWLYNNYWYTNFPSAAPGWFRVKYLLAFRHAPFDPVEADRLYHHFHTPFLFHPLWPRA